MIVPVDTVSRTILINGRRRPCAIGRSGAISADSKREGDGATPIGRWPVRGVLLRPDGGINPPMGTPWRWIRADDGWCDDPVSASYNQPVTHPARARAERLWRTDHAYDAILVLGYNDRPSIPDLGSAIFLHLRASDATEGCVVVERSDMEELIVLLAVETIVDIQ